MQFTLVIPAEAGIAHGAYAIPPYETWMPACAGKTELFAICLRRHPSSIFKGRYEEQKIGDSDNAWIRTSCLFVVFAVNVNERF